MQKLSKDEMKKVMGGVTEPISCTCTDCVGAWSYSSTPTGIQTLDDIVSYCRTGFGSCTNGASLTPPPPIQ